MTILRDALAEALHPGVPCYECRSSADRLLSDPVFRAALVEAVAEAMYRDCPCDRPTDHRDDALQVVARMRGGRP